MFQKLKNYYHFLQALAAAIIFKFPSKELSVIGVTGTDGKTTTVNMIYEILKAAGKKVSIVSSISAQIGSKLYDTGFHVTTPSPWQTQRYLRKAADSGAEYFVLEATSHGLDQNRLAFIKFKLALITNITPEHLDYHKNWQNYAEAKLKLFKNVDFSVLNEDDKSFELLNPKVDGKVITYSINHKSDFNPKNFPLKLKIIGSYNSLNALAAAASTSVLGIPNGSVKKALNNFSALTGRMDEIDLGQKFTVYVDFAHTPNALESALKSLKAKHPDQKSRLIAVFGAAGDRDRQKRAPMGKIAAQNADISILTAEDPRKENVTDIIYEISKGFLEKGKKKNRDFYQIDNRRDAISFAINLAQDQDVVCFFGKGHEKSMCYGKKEFPWNEINEVKGAIRRRLNDSPTKS
jgi:UDP-N-acetylmuramoyl-L-alanyl-D-glutamate--2,6-diaminopimelate ligase